jgi:succinyl-CoA synthetase alpha subunit
MSILVDNDTRVVVQGVTGSAGSFHTRQMLEYGTQIVAGVTPGKGGAEVEGVPVFGTVAQAVRETGANCSVIYVPAPFADDAIMEAADAGVPLVVCITEGVPTLHFIRAKRFAAERNVRVVGPNCPGVITPGAAKVGIMPGYIHQPGKVGVISRSGTLTYEVVWQLSQLGLGQSTCVGIGGDQVVGTGFIDLLDLFQNDPDTEAIVMIGEIGGAAEVRAGEYIKDNVTKPVVAFIAGETAPPAKRMGHAGAIVGGADESAEAKARLLEQYGVTVEHNPSKLGEAMQGLLTG